jgi:phenylacetic acid degradation operon negative regulatory protein
VPGLDGRSATDLLITLGGLILDPDVGKFHIRRFAARVPVTVLGELGIAQNAIRMALAREVQRGLLSTTRVGREVVYDFTVAGERIVNEAGLRVRAQRPFDAASTVWTLASFSVPESRRDLRSRLRIHLTQSGFRPLRDGLWVALDSLAAELVTRDLDADLAENCQLDIFIATPFRTSSLVDVIRRGWDLGDLRARHATFLSRWEHLDISDTRGALPLLVLFSADWFNLLKHDPGLPAESLGDDWPGERSAATAYRLYDALQDPAGDALERLLVATDPSGRNP